MLSEWERCPSTASCRQPGSLHQPCVPGVRARTGARHPRPRSHRPTLPLPLPPGPAPSAAARHAAPWKLQRCTSARLLLRATGLHFGAPVHATGSLHCSARNLLRVSSPAAHLYTAALGHPRPRVAAASTASAAAAAAQVLLRWWLGRMLIGGTCAAAAAAQRCLQSMKCCCQDHRYPFASPQTLRPKAESSSVQIHERVSL